MCTFLGPSPRIGEDGDLVLKVPVPNASDAGNRPTVLLVGRGEPMDAALRLALDRHSLTVEEVPGDVRTAVLTMAPDLVLLVGDAARDGGHKILDQLSADATVASTPVAVLGAGSKLDARVAAYRHGAVAVIPRTASADAIATRVAILVREIQERAAAPQAELGEATFDELVDMVSRELRSGILSVQSKDGEPMRVVLGAGRPVAAAVEEFVRRLRPLVARAEPLTYELHVSSGGQLGLLDAEPGPELEPVQLEGLRVLLVDTEPARADALAQELRARKVVVSVADASGRGLERARGLDPEIVILDAAGMEGPGFDVLRTIRRDVRLRWASMLVAPWDEIWPDPESMPDIARLSERIAPLVVHDQQLRRRAASEASFDTRLEATGPCRLLRILTDCPHALHVTFRSRAASVEVDLAEGLVVGAQGNANGAPVEAVHALAAILAMGSARVHVERRDNPATANLMAPVDEALARATEEAKPLPLSQPPPAMSGGSLPGVRSRPFPAASELKEQAPKLSGRIIAGAFASSPNSPSSSGNQPSIVPRPGAVSKMSSPSGSKGLSWADSEETALPKVPAPKSAFAALFDADPLSESADVAPEESTAIYDSVELARLAQSQDARASARPDPSEAPSRDAAAPLPRGTLTGLTATPAGGVPAPPSTSAQPAMPPPAPRIPARKQTLVMGTLLRSPPLPSTGPNTPVGPRAEPSTRNATLTMGSAPPPPDKIEVRAPEAKGAALSAFGPLAKRSPASSLPPASAATAVSAFGGRDSRAESSPEPSSSSLDELVADLTSLPPESGSAPLARVSNAPPPTQTLTDASALLLPSEELESDTAISIPPLPAGPPATPPPAAPPPATPGAPPRSRDIGLMATLPAGAPAATPPDEPPAPVNRTAPYGPVSAQAPSVGIAGPIAPPAVDLPIAGAPSATTTFPPPAPRSGTRVFAWLLVGAGLTLLVAVGGLLIWTRMLGHALPVAIPGFAPPSDGEVTTSHPPPEGTPPEGTPPEAIPGTPDSTLPGSTALPDAGEPAATDAGVDAPSDAGVDAPEPEEVEVATDEPEDPGSPSDPVAHAEALVARADGATDPVAETYYRQALALDPRNHYAMLGIAEILMRRGDAAGAVPLLEGAVARRRNRAPYRILLGDARRAAGDAAGARRAWQEALEIEPDNRAARSRLGL